jgi:transitional endoplasmic reticulum ATPase
VVLTDKYLRLHLRTRVGETILVEPFEGPDAQELHVWAPPAWASSEGGRLLGSLLHGRPVCRGQKVPVFTFSGATVVVEVAQTRPDGIVLVTGQTQISVESQPAREQAAGITYQDIGGLDREIRRIRELIEFPLRSPDAFAHLGIEAPRGIILYGPPGTGKTLIAKALSNEVGAQFFAIQGPEIVSPYYGESERQLREVFERAHSNAPAVILMDELDALAPKREETRGELERRLVATLLSLMDGLTALKGVVVIGTTNRLNALDPALRRPGRFEHEIHVGVPDLAGRRGILTIHTRRMPLAGNVDTQLLAEKTPGFVGADLAALCREAGYAAMRRCFPPESLEHGEFFADEGMQITAQDFQSALSIIQPSAMREVMVQIPYDVNWDQIGGLDDVKQLIIESVVYGIQKAEAYRTAGIRPAKGLLLYGPPGTGKTLLAKAVANECGANFITVRGPEVHSKWFGESEEKVRFVFARAREVTPCVIFFDEIDAIAPARGRDASGLTDSIVNQLLAEMDGIETVENVFVIAATNMADLLDPALLRPGRFDLQVYVPLPDQAARQRIFQVHLQRTPLAQGVNLTDLAAQTEGRSGADIAEICRLAALYALREVSFAPKQGFQVTTAHFRHAMDDVERTHRQLKPRRLGFQLPGEEE